MVPSVQYELLPSYGVSFAFHHRVHIGFLLVVALAVRAFPTVPACVCIEACRRGPNSHVRELAAVVPTQNVVRKHRCSVHLADGLVQLYAFLDMATMQNCLYSIPTCTRVPASGTSSYLAIATRTYTVGSRYTLSL